MKRTLLLLLTLATAPLFAQGSSPFIGLRVDSRILGESRQMIVRLPASYRTGLQSYPVLYMTDGDSNIGHTNTIMEFLVREQSMPEMIIVGITNTDRTRDLTPTRIDLRPTSGGADKFLQFIETELIPTVEKNYRTRPYRILAGHSLGGLFVMHSLFERPTLFNAWISISPVLGWDNNIVNRRAAEFVREHRDVKGKLVMTIAEEGRELDVQFEQFQSLMRSRKPKNFEVVTQKLGDEDHGTVVLPSHYFGLRQIFNDWRFRFVAGAEIRKLPAQVRDHYARLSERMGYTVIPAESTMNTMGYFLVQKNLLREAIETFSTNVANYPNSPNAYDSLGEAYERSGDLAKARENYERAAKLARETSDPNAAVFAQHLERVTKALGSGSE